MKASVSLLLILLAGCSQTVVKSDIPCPALPNLKPISRELQLQTPTEVLEIVTENQLELKRHILKLRARLECDNDSV